MVVIQLIFDNNDFYNYIILITVKKYWSDEESERNDFNT